MTTFEQFFTEASLVKHEYLINVPDDKYSLTTLKIEVIEPEDTSEEDLKTIAKRRFLQKKYDALHAKKNLGAAHKSVFFRNHFNKCVVKPV